MAGDLALRSDGVEPLRARGEVRAATTQERSELWWRRGGAQPRKGSNKQGEQTLSGEVKDSDPTLLRFTDLGEP
jgi:hypothetical protein